MVASDGQLGEYLLEKSKQTSIAGARFVICALTK